MTGNIAFEPKGRKAAIAALGAILIVSSAAQAHASPGCDAVNAGGFDRSVTNAVPGFDGADATIDDFVAGDRIDFTLTHLLSAGSDTAVWSLVHTGGTLDTVTLLVAGTELRSYTVTGNQDTTLSEVIVRYWFPLGGQPTGTFSVTATCTPAPSSQPPTQAPADSDKLAAAQLGVAKIVAATSGAAITGATSNAINSALANGSAPFAMGPNGFHFNFAAEPDATHAALAALGNVDSTLDAALHAWLDVSGTGWERASVDLDGTQLNVTAGLGRKLTPEVVAGIFAGFEHFDYAVPSLPGTVSGDGATIGAYAGGTFDSLRWDATFAGSLLGYELTAGVASGAFNASRLLASGGLTGDFEWSGVLLEPSARLFVLVENEDAYTDSLGNTHAARNFAVGRASLGGKASYPLALESDVVLSPYAGLYGDYHVSTDSAVLPLGQPDLWIGDGTSLRAVGGASLALPVGATLTLGGELGGIGADHTMWRLNGTLSGEF